jgi:hypothetical protein
MGVRTGTKGNIQKNICPRLVNSSFSAVTAVIVTNLGIMHRTKMIAAMYLQFHSGGSGLAWEKLVGITDALSF